jgi:hypothetical protein
MFIRIVSTFAAFIAGALAWVLPPHALGRIVDHYPPTAWPWLGDGLWNAMPLVSVPITMVIGALYGFFNPKCWYLSFLATWLIVPFNIVLDGTHDPTSHNLFPFELLIFAALPTSSCLPRRGLISIRNTTRRKWMRGVK